MIYRPFLKVRDVAAQMGVSEKTVRRWIKSGRLPAYRLTPGTVRVDREDVERMLRPPADEPPGEKQRRDKR